MITINADQVKWLDLLIKDYEDNMYVIKEDAGPEFDISAAYEMLRECQALHDKLLLLVKQQEALITDEEAREMFVKSFPDEGDIPF